MSNFEQGGDSPTSVTIDDLFGPSDEGTADVVSSDQPEPALEAEDADSGVEEEEQESEPTEGEEPAESSDPNAVTAESLAKEYGLDLKNPAHRKVIDRLLKDSKAQSAMDKRIKDSQNYIASLQEKISQGDFLAKFENDLFKSKGAPQQQQRQTPQQQPRQTADSPAPVRKLGDGYDHWNTAEDAQSDYAEAWEKGDKRKAADIQIAFNNRWYTEAAVPHIQGLIQQEIQRHVGPVLQSQHAQQQQQMEEDARFDALDAIKAGDPDMAKLLEEMFKPDGTTIEINGRQEPSNAIWKLSKEYPEIYDIRVDRGDPRESARATWARRYLALAKLHMNQKRQSVMATEKSGKIFKAGQQTAAAQAQKEKVRQSITSGTSKGKARQLSASDQFMAELSQSGGVVGISADSLFK